MIINKIFFAFALLNLAACSSTLPLNYVPSASIRGNGDIKIGTIRYMPFENGEVATDQFQEASAAIGDMHLSDPVSKIINTALRKELIAGGFTIEPGASLVIEADVVRFLYDWIGFVEVDFYLDIDFKLIKNGSPILIHRSSSHQKAPKTTAQDAEAIRAAISECIDDFFMDAHEKKLM